jgi:hypothetical protein
MQLLARADAYAVAAVTLGLARTLITQITALVALALVLRRSQPSERPELVAAMTGSLPWRRISAPLSRQAPQKLRSSARPSGGEARNGADLI